MARIELTADTTFNTTNLQSTLDDLASNYDLRGFTATVQLTPGIYYGNIELNGKLVGQKGKESLVILGDTSTPSNAEIVGSMVFRNGAQATIKGFWFHNGSYGIAGDDPGTRLYIENCWFGHQFIPMTDCAIVAGVGSRIQAAGSLRLRGNAQGFVKALGPAQAQLMNGTHLTLENTPYFSVGFAYAAEGGLINSGISWSGAAATGAQYCLSFGSKIYTAGTYTSFPGSGVGNYCDSSSVIA